MPAWSAFAFAAHNSSCQRNTFLSGRQPCKAGGAAAAASQTAYLSTHTHVCQANTHTHKHTYIQTLHKLTQHTQTRGHMKNLHMLILFTFKTLQKQFVHKISCFFLLSFVVRNSHHTHAHSDTHTLRQFSDGACLRTTRFTAVPSPVRATSELCNKRMWVEREALLSRWSAQRPLPSALCSLTANNTVQQRCESGGVGNWSKGSPLSFIPWERGKEERRGRQRALLIICSHLAAAQT